MKTNMGTLDRGGRFVVAFILIWAAYGTAFAATGILHWPFLAIAAVFSLTSIIGNCRLYSLVGIKTCRDS